MGQTKVASVHRVGLHETWFCCSGQCERFMKLHMVHESQAL